MEWISVDDRLPEPNEEVKIKLPDDRETYAFLCNLCHKCWRCPVTGGGMMVNPTHWQPLPEPPEVNR